MQISFESNFNEYSKYLRDFQKKHLPSIYRNTLNGIAFECQRALKADLPRQVKSPTPYTLSGIQVEKTDKTKLESKVGYVSKTFGKAKAGAGILPAEYMSRLNTGGVRMPERKAIAVPVLKNYRPNKFGNIKRNDITNSFPMIINILLASPGASMIPRLQVFGKEWAGVEERILPWSLPGKMTLNTERPTTSDNRSGTQ